MYFGLVDWWTGGLPVQKRNPKWTGGLVTITFFEVDWGLVLVPFKMYWCTRCIFVIEILNQMITALHFSFLLEPLEPFFLMGDERKHDF